LSGVEVSSGSDSAAVTGDNIFAAARQARAVDAVAEHDKRLPLLVGPDHVDPTILAGAG